MKIQRCLSWLLLPAMLFVCLRSRIPMAAGEEYAITGAGPGEEAVMPETFGTGDPETRPEAETDLNPESMPAEEELVFGDEPELDPESPESGQAEDLLPLPEDEPVEQEETESAPTETEDGITEEQEEVPVPDNGRADAEDDGEPEGPREDELSQPTQEEKTAEPTERPVKTAEERAYIQRRLQRPYTIGKRSETTLRAKSPAGGPLPESDHPYESNEDRYWTLTADGEAAAVSITFSNETFVEDGDDFIALYNAKGGKIGTYTGNALAGKTITIAGNQIVIRLVTDSFYSEYGFAVTACEFLDEIPIDAVTLKKGPQVTVSWSAPFCTVGYEVQRATVNPATGETGEYRNIGATGTESFTDSNIAWGMVYSYRVRAYKTLVYQGKSYRYYTAYRSRTIYIVRTPRISGGFGSKWYQGVVLNWEAVTGAKKYIVYRSETANGNYVRLAETTALTYTDMIPERKNYYYKLRMEATVMGTTYVSLASEAFMCGYIGTPVNLTAQPAGSNAIRLQWTGCEGASGYVIYRSQDPDSGYQYITSTTATVITTYVPRMGEVYYYRIKAFTPSKVYSGFSDIAAVMPMDAPQNPWHVTHTKTSVTLRWDAVPGADYYKVFTSYTGTNWPAFGQTEATVYTFSELEESYQYSYFIVKAYKEIPLGNGTAVAISPGSQKLSVEKNMVNFRYLAVFEEDYPDPAEDRPTYGNNEKLFKSMLSKATPYGRPIVPTGTGTGTNLSKAQLIQRITSGLMAQADSNDISLFYINCHGNDSIATGVNAGMLKLSDGQTMAMQELAGLLQDVKGRVIVIIDSCGSGSAILEVQQDAAASFNKAVVQAFKNVDEEIALIEPVTEENAGPEDDMLPSHGEFRVLNKFYVITACEAGRKGYGNTQGTILLKRLNAAIASADTDENGVVVMRELERYLKATGSEPLPTISGTDYMVPQVYPSNSSFEIFRKK